MERKNGGGRSASSAEPQDTRATVVRASCPEPSFAKQLLTEHYWAGRPLPSCLRPPACGITKHSKPIAKMSADMVSGGCH